MASKTDKQAQDIKKSATYLERIPVVGRFFKAVRLNQEGRGPGTNDMSAPSSRLSGGKYQTGIGAKASSAMNNKKKKASDAMKSK